MEMSNDMERINRIKLTIRSVMTPINYIVLATELKIKSIRAAYKCKKETRDIRSVREIARAIESACWDIYGYNLKTELEMKLVRDEWREQYR